MNIDGQIHVPASLALWNGHHCIRHQIMLEPRGCGHSGDGNKFVILLAVGPQSTSFPVSTVSCQATLSSVLLRVLLTAEMSDNSDILNIMYDLRLMPPSVI